MQKSVNWSCEKIEGPMLRPKEACKYLGVSRSTFYELVKQGVFPPLIKLVPNGRASALPKSWLDKVLSLYIEGELNEQP